MKEFLYASCPTAIWCIAAVELVLCVIMYISFSKTKKPILLLTALISTGLFLDALGISLGTVLSEEVLAAVSPIRFVAHGVLIPLLYAICAYALNFGKIGKAIVWIIVGVLMVAGLAEALATVKVLTLEDVAGVLRYKAIKDQIPGWASIISSFLTFGTVIPLMIAGIFVWIKQKTPCLFLSGFFMFLFSALPYAVGLGELMFYISMFGELLMVIFLFIYAANKKK